LGFNYSRFLLFLHSLSFYFFVLFSDFAMQIFKHLNIITMPHNPLKKRFYYSDKRNKIESYPDEKITHEPQRKDIAKLRNKKCISRALQRGAPYKVGVGNHANSRA